MVESGQNEVDELFDARNSYYIGNYQQCINEAQRCKVCSDEDKLERDVFLYRAYLAQKKYSVLMSEISEMAAPELKALKILAGYYMKRLAAKDATLAFEGLLKGANNHHVIIAFATLVTDMAEFEKGLKILHGNDHMEMLALNVLIYLKLHRMDYAQKYLKMMQEKDEDCTLTQLAQAWINITLGKEKMNDAYYIFQELMDKYGKSAMLMNCQAVCCMGQEKYEEADSLVQDALEKDSNNASLLINSAVLTAYTGKSAEVSNRFLMQLKDGHPDCELLKDNAKKEEDFDRLCVQYAI